MTKHRILCVDDEIDNVEALERLFRKKYSVLKATSGEEGLRLLDQNPEGVSVIISDQRMPEMTGVEFLEKSLLKQPEAIRILLTGYTDIDSIIGAVNKGQIFRYLTKPWDSVDLKNTVDHAIERFSVGQELRVKNIELEKALKELEALDKAKSDFMILVNHELRTPITVILSFLSLLTETRLDEEQKIMLDRIVKNTDRLKALIDDVLLILRSENNQIKANSEDVFIYKLVGELPSTLLKLMKQKNQTLVLPSPPQKVRADANYLQQILFRLLHNASQFGDESSEIFLELKPLEKRIQILIRNKGPQIPTPIINKVFKPFVLNENIMNHRAGLGIGLTICQALLKLQSSHLHIQNHDQGVVISFELPAV